MNLKEIIRVIPDFPKPGIRFIDITTLLKNRNAYKTLIDQMAMALEGKQIDTVVGPEARGFVIGAPLAYAINAGFVPVRKSGKLPAETIAYEYELEYGTDILEIHKDAIKPGDKVVIVDDLLATGGTSLATAKLVEKLGGEIIGIVFAIELTFLNGREVLKDYPVTSIVQFS
ncbi:MAG: adenine phosphoribosyltransferase [Clostridia bacterium]